MSRHERDPEITRAMTAIAVVFLLVLGWLVSPLLARADDLRGIGGCFLHVQPGEVTPDRHHLTEVAVYFDFDSASLRPNDEILLADTAAAVRQHGVVAVIEAYTDKRGADDYNVELGASRLATVEGVLHNFGVPVELLTGENYGESRAEIPEDLPHEDRQPDRRVDVSFEVMEPGSERPATMHAAEYERLPCWDCANAGYSQPTFQLWGD